MTAANDDNTKKTFSLNDLVEDQDAAFHFVMESMSPATRAEIERIRTILGAEKKHSAFLMLAMASELLVRMETVEQDLHEPLDRTATLILDLATQMESRVSAIAAIKAQDVRLLERAAQEALKPLDEAVSVLRESERNLLKASADVNASKNAISTIDDDALKKLVDLVALKIRVFHRRY